ncbi:MAG: dihydrofolate reductase family protein [Acidobacteriota bacterium]
MWTGWWGANPPFHTPVFVLTHHPREPLEMQGGTTFIFVADGIESALGQAMTAARGRDVALGGGADVAQQHLAAGLIDEMEIHLVPLLLGGGTRLLDGLGDAEVKLEPVRTTHGPGVAHLKYRVITHASR